MLRSILLLLAVVAPTLAVECPICRIPGRYITKPNKVVDTSGGSGAGEKYTCQQLYEIFDAKSDPDGPYIGFTSCRIAQAWAEQECGCAGAPIAPLPVLENEVCNLCGDSDRSVAADKKDLLVPVTDPAIRSVIGSWIVCGAWELAGLSKGLNAVQCGMVTTAAAFPCGCFDKNVIDGGGEAPSPPTLAPVPARTRSPTRAPTRVPTRFPTVESTPTTLPTPAPVPAPTRAPTRSPTRAPTRLPTRFPTVEATPTTLPTPAPVPAPTRAPTRSPTRAPTRPPTRFPTIPSTPPILPTGAPTRSPTRRPTRFPTPAPNRRRSDETGEKCESSEIATDKQVYSQCEDITVTFDLCRVCAGGRDWVGLYPCQTKPWQYDDFGGFNATHAGHPFMWDWLGQDPTTAIESGQISFEDKPKSNCFFFYYKAWPIEPGCYHALLLESEACTTNGSEPPSNVLAISEPFNIQDTSVCAPDLADVCA